MGNTEVITDINKVIIDAILDKKGLDVKMLDLRGLDDGVCDFFIVAHGDSHPQVKAIADNIRTKLKEELNESPWHVEGTSHLQWVVIDYISTVIHLFHKEKRYFYNLEELWSDAKVEAFE